MTEDAWLTVEEISKRLGFHPDTVRRLLREGAIEGHRINRRAGWRVRASEVDRYVQEGPKKSGPTDEPSGR